MAAVNSPLQGNGNASTGGAVVQIAPSGTLIASFWIRNYDSTNDISLAFDGVNYVTTLKAGEQISRSSNIQKVGVKCAAGTPYFEWTAETLPGV